MKNIARFGTVVLAVGFLAAFALPALGQSLFSRGFCGLSLGGLFPTGEFNQHVPQEGYGAAAYYTWRLGRSPLLVGVEAAYSEYGHAHRVEYLEGIPEAGVDVDTSNSIAQGLLLLRLQPRSGRIVTFVEGLAGMSYLWTETTIGDPDDEGSYSASETNLYDFTWTAGVGAGVSFRLKAPGGGSDPELSRAGGFLELKVRYMAGGWAEYLKKGSIVVDGNGYTYTPERSTTNVITVQVGFSWFF